jgi:hypothetical protein
MSAEFDCLLCASSARGHVTLQPSLLVHMTVTSDFVHRDYLISILISHRAIPPTLEFHH